MSGLSSVLRKKGYYHIGCLSFVLGQIVRAYVFLVQLKLNRCAFRFLVDWGVTQYLNVYNQWKLADQEILLERRAIYTPVPQFFVLKQQDIVCKPKQKILEKWQLFFQDGVASHSQTWIWSMNLEGCLFCSRYNCRYFQEEVEFIGRDIWTSASKTTQFPKQDAAKMNSEKWDISKSMLYHIW